LVTDALTSAGPSRVVLEDLTLKVLLDVASGHPRLVMNAVGRCLIDPGRRPYFNFHRFHGLFEAIGEGEVQQWVAKHPDLIRQLAYQLDSPCLQDNKPFIPPVSEWLMTKFGDDDHVFREFCAGRHSFEITEGHARDRRADLERNMAPFLEHTLPWVRRWAEWELKENENDAKMDDYMDDRRERM
jgi:hypothetical protein